ncbi:phospholipase D family protein [Pontibacter sp. BAB1700]|uniref:phospholipase D family protein n=1 Tax=Pontibacter sp. BAB1700 TaxID=1144253 RepID=UPI00026BE166|nr:phospholipase D family protein [Pontibacter sp. BAB1700]EJF08368.1 hypothetical protein O71_21242 [Pontibacter sp. BAB1700]
MRLIINSAQLTNEFERLMGQYQKYYWTTAWAGVSSKHFDYLKKNQGKIQKIVVGLHFYQTHPNFIETFLTNSSVKFIKQPQGTFHPKLYLFYDTNRRWELLIGSANFTGEAFTRNTEATVLIGSSDDANNDTLDKAFELVEESWANSAYFTKDELAKYRLAWQNLRPKLNSLSGTYGGANGKTSKPIYEVAASSMTWKEFIKKVKDETAHGLRERLRVISISKGLFQKVNHFEELSNDERKFISGLPNHLHINGSVDWAFFGSMKGAGQFANRIINNDVNISLALDYIPLKGQITRQHYDNFVQTFKLSLPGNYIATATRLLAMKRPDVFFCLTSKNQKAFCEDFGVVYNSIDYNGYWEQVIERIYDSEWWLNPNPKTTEEKQVSDARAAFLDSIYYER